MEKIELCPQFGRLIGFRDVIGIDTGAPEWPTHYFAPRLSGGI